MVQGLIALEEHFAMEETVLERGPWTPKDWPELRARLLDIHERRLIEMDAHGVELMVLSLNNPGAQGMPNPESARDLARRANDYLAEQVARRPGRFQGFAALPMQSPDYAAEELRRCVDELGFRGALVNGFSQIGDGAEIAFLDEDRYRPFWSEAERLDVPFYLHPRNPMPADARIYRGHSWMMGPTWAFGQETAVHALRLMGSGLFDAHPRLKIVLGHMGEGLPFSLWRVDNRTSWMSVQNVYPAKRKIADYFNENFFITTSGNLSTQALIATMLVVGADRILFSTDWPFETIGEAAEWFNATPISPSDRLKIGRDNARALLKL